MRRTRVLGIVTILVFALLMPAVGWAEEEQAWQPEPPMVAQEEAPQDAVVLSARAHVQNIGWQNEVSNSDNHIVVGTSGKGLRVEALGIWIADASGKALPSVTYQAHVQNIGWEGWQRDGGESGSTGKGLRLEAIRIKLEDQLAANYDLYYRVHVQNLGWMGWTKDGQLAGSAGRSLRMEAVELWLVDKGQQGPAVSDAAFADAGFGVRAHVQNVGWQPVASGYSITAGTSGRGLRMEALSIARPHNDLTGDVVYEAHVQNVGWQGQRKNGQIAGTQGEGLRIEALRIGLTGQLEERYDIWYRLHVQNVGWMGWAKNGDSAGTAGMALRVEAVQIVLSAKGAAAPSAADQSFALPFANAGLAGVTYRTTLVGGSSQAWKSDGAQSNDTGAGMRALEAQLTGGVSGSIAYSVHVSNVGWMSEVSNGAVAGANNNAIEAITMRLSGQVGSLYSVWYRAHMQGKGWTGWGTNGQRVGSSGYGRPLEAVQVVLRPNGSGAPGSTEGRMDERPTLSIIQSIQPSLEHGNKPAQYQKYIVLHDTEGVSPVENVLEGWLAQGTYVAAHFVVGIDGRVLQCVSLDKIAHHAGFGDSGFNARFGVEDESRDDRRGTSNSAGDYGMNSYSVGIELVHSSGYSTTYPEVQLKALDALIAYIDSYYGFQSQIIQHKDWAVGNSDCSAEFQGYLRNYQRTRTHNG